MNPPRTTPEALQLFGNMIAIAVVFVSSMVVFLADSPLQSLRSNLPILLALNGMFVLPMIALHVLQFARSERQWESEPMPGEVVVGDNLGPIRGPTILTEVEREGHLGVFGATRSGKSTLAESMAAQDIWAGRATIVVDPHGSMANTLAAHSLSAGRLPMLLCADGDRMPTINMLESGPGYTAYDAARIVAEGLSNVFIPFQEELPVRLRNVLETAAYFLAAADEGYTVLELPRYILQPAFRHYLAQRAVDSSSGSRWIEPEHALTVLAWLNSLNPTQLYQQNQSSFVRLAGLLSSPDARRIFGTSGSTIDFDSIGTGAPLLVSLQRERLHHGAKLANGMVLSWLTHRLQTRPPGSDGSYPPIYMYLDELADASPAVFENLLLVAGKRSVRLTILVQSQDMLDPRLRGSMMSNLNAIVVLRSNGPGVDELVQQIFVPPTFDAEAAFGGSSTPRARQMADLAVRIRSLPTHHYILRSAYRPDQLLMGRSLLDHRVTPDRAAASRRTALQYCGRTVAEIDREIQARVTRLNTRFGPISGYRDDRILQEMMPW